MKKNIHFHWRNLPHIYIPEATYFITYRLKNSLPTRKIQELRKNFMGLSFAMDKEEKYKRNKIFFKKYDELLGENEYGPLYLGISEVAEVVKSSLHYYDCKEYCLIAYTVMSNHVHVVFSLYKHSRSVDRIMKSIKGYSARKANLLLNRSGNFWQAESYDHIVRGEREFLNVVRYVIMNPVKAGLVEDWRDWPHTYLIDFTGGDRSNA